MTELERLSAQLEAAVKMQANAERLYHKSAENIEKLKKQMLEAKEKNKPKAAKVEELFAAGVQARKALQEMCDNAYGDGKAKISILVYVPAEAQDYPTDTDCEFSL
nr:MAG TPA: immunity protein [Caudoviricetes sp.]